MRICNHSPPSPELVEGESVSTGSTYGGVNGYENLLDCDIVLLLRRVVDGMQPKYNLSVAWPTGRSAAGVMFWTFEHDTLNDDLSLLKAIADVVDGN